MRVVVVHNRYRSDAPSGENDVVDGDVAQLREAGVEVERYERSSDEVDDMGIAGRVGLAIRPVSSPSDRRAFLALIRRFRPDIVHLHNPFPLISPSVVRWARSEAIPVVQTVHNYRHVCMNGMFLRDGRVCEDCRGHAFPWPGALHGCYRGSRAQSLAMAGALFAHRGTWQLVDRFMVLTGFMADHLRRAGIAADRIVVKPNAVRDPGPVAPGGTGFLYAGRLKAEKGTDLLVDAWRGAGRSLSRLVIAGDGPDRPAVEALAAAHENVEYVGTVDSAGVAALLRACAVAVVPSACLEGLPLFLAEAFAHGRPVLASTLGGMPEVVGDDRGWLATPTVPGLQAALHDADQPTGWAQRSQSAREYYSAHFAPPTVLAQTLAVYAEVAPG